MRILMSLPSFPPTKVGKKFTFSRPASLSPKYAVVFFANPFPRPSLSFFTGLSAAAVFKKGPSLLLFLLLLPHLFLPASKKNPRRRGKSGLGHALRVG